MELSFNWRIKTTVIQTCPVSGVTVPQKAVTHEMHSKGQDGMFEKQ